MDIKLILNIAIGVIVGKFMYDFIHDIYNSFYWKYDRYLNRHGKGPYRDLGPEDEDEEEDGDDEY